MRFVKYVLVVVVLALTVIGFNGLPSHAGQNCDPSYPDVCIAPPPPDLDCQDIVHRNFRVTGDDPHHFDGDDDGIGCEA